MTWATFGEIVAGAQQTQHEGDGGHDEDVDHEEQQDAFGYLRNVHNRQRCDCRPKYFSWQAGVKGIEGDCSLKPMDRLSINTTAKRQGTPWESGTVAPL
jgi:hypothetical protein